MNGPTRAEVLATPPRDADAEVRALLEDAEDCQPEWQERPTRTTVLPSIDNYEEPEMTDDLSKRIAAALREHGMVHLGDQVPADEYDCCGEVALAALGLALHPDDGSHVYLSTSCLHGDHDYCQNDKGNNGAVSWHKMPGECKFCGSPCTCSCHREAGR